MTPDQLERAARDALATMTTPETIGSVLSSDLSDGVATLRFSSTLPGYVGWDWVVSLAVDGDATTVLETELLAGDGAIVAPDWVPWADRLKEYEASLAAGIEEPDVIVIDDESDSEFDDDDDDDDDDDFSDDVDSLDLTDVVESPFEDSDVFDGVDDAGSEDDAIGDEYVVVEDEPKD